MNLEEAIQQKNFNSEYQKLILNIIYTNTWIEEPIRRLLLNHKITLAQYNILRILKGSDPNPLSPGEIKGVMLHKKTDLTRMLDRLESKSLIIRKTCKKNRRQVDVWIKETGKQLLEQLKPQIESASEKRISNKITPQEASMLNELLDKIRK